MIQNLILRHEALFGRRGRTRLALVVLVEDENLSALTTRAVLNEVEVAVHLVINASLEPKTRAVLALMLDVR